MMRGGRRSIRLRHRGRARVRRDMILGSGGSRGRGHEWFCTLWSSVWASEICFSVIIEVYDYDYHQVYRHGICIEYKIFQPS
jgi:hypothetical protein